MGVTCHMLICMNKFEVNVSETFVDLSYVDNWSMPSKQSRAPNQADSWGQYQVDQRWFGFLLSVVSWQQKIVGNITFFLRPNAIQCTVISNLLNILEASLADHPAINWASPTGHPQSAGFSLLWPHRLLGHLNGTFLFCLHKCGDVNVRPRYMILFRTGQTWFQLKLNLKTESWQQSVVWISCELFPLVNWRWLIGNRRDILGAPWLLSKLHLE